jgi:EAL domain-containing protein (putative c-di-GMP-specific phosphodiesterase class I)
VKFSLDDFGTGYSSLSYLRKFPVNKIKIDKSFVQGIPQDKEALAIIRAVSTLAQNLGIRLNAEGIEEEPQVHLLRMLGCTEGQGYLFGKPQSAEDIVKRIQAEISATVTPWRLAAS